MKGYVLDCGFLVFADGMMAASDVLMMFWDDDDDEIAVMVRQSMKGEMFKRMSPEQERAYRSMAFDCEAELSEGLTGRALGELATTGPTDEPDEGPMKWVNTGEIKVRLPNAWVTQGYKDGSISIMPRPQTRVIHVYDGATNAP